MTCDTPSDEIERSSSMPLMVLTASSILSVTSVSICSGAAPGLHRRDDDGREVDLGKPIDAELREGEGADDGQRQDQHVAKTGRLTQSAASHCMTIPKQAGRPALDLGAVGELRDVLRRHALAGLEPVGDLDQIVDRAGRS